MSRSQLCAPELLQVILTHIQPREVLKMSLLFPDLFTEGMWRSLVKEWDHYAFLSEKVTFSPRKKYAEIAYRTCLLSRCRVRRSGTPSSCSQIRSFSKYYGPEQQALFAIHRKRKDIIQQLASEYPSVLVSLYYKSMEEEKIYFNRPMFNYLASLLGIKVSERENFIADPEPREEYSIEQSSDHINVSVIQEDENLYSRWAKNFSQEQKGDLKMRFVKEVCLGVDSEFWFSIYSKSQEKEILEKLIQESNESDLSIFGVRSILRNLFRSNHVQLAAKFSTKLGVDLQLQTILSCLACYYFNTGDDKGLYESLLHMEERKILKPGVYSSDIFTIELPEVVSLLERNGIKEGRRIDLSQPLIPLTHTTY
jgi:hypothetical protein